MAYNIFRLILAIVFCTNCYGQGIDISQTDVHRSCGHNQIKNSIVKGELERANFEQKLIDKKNSAQPYKMMEDSIVLPVAVHFQNFATLDTACLINQAIDAIQRLNADFHGTNADISNWGLDQASFPTITNGASKITFCLATFNHPEGYNLEDGDLSITFNQTSGDNNVDWEGYLNIYVRDILSYAGYSPPGGFGNGDGVTIDDNYFGTIECNGIPIEANFSLNRTVTHEIGHYLFLEHTWGPSPIDTDTSITCAEDDSVEDTPLAGTGHYGCPAIGQMSCGTLDLTMNFMEYVNDQCMYMFTAGQVERMELYAGTFMTALTSNKFFVCDGYSYCMTLPGQNDCTPTEGNFRIENVNSEKSLLVVGGDLDDFAKVVQWDWIGCDYQQWYLEPQPNGFYKIFAKHSNKVIDAIFPDGIAFQFSDDSFLTQFWSIVPDPNDNCIFQIKSAVDENYGLGIIYQSIFNGWNLQLQELQPNNNAQKFRFHNLNPSLATSQINLNLKIFLQGAYDPSSGQMNDKLRSQGLIPITNPYATDADFDHISSESTSPQVLTQTGENAIIDWVLIEIRRKTDPSVIVESRAALLQSDGDIVDTDGVSPISFQSLANNYYVAIKHRNHLSVMTQNPILLDENTVIDFTDPNFTLFGQNAMQITNNNVGVMWAGNANSNENIIFQGINNDTNEIFFEVLTNDSNVQGAVNFIYSGYHKSDVNMDGEVIYQGANNDANVIFFNTLIHPENSTGSTNFIITEQMP